MIDAIIHFSIRNKLVVALLLLGLVLWGSYGLLHLPIDAVPDVTNNQVQVITRSPSLAPLEVERYITAPVEYEMASIPGLQHTRSISRFGLSVVTLVFDDGVDVYWARNQVLERLRNVQDAIPPGLGVPEMAPVTTGLGEVYQYTLQMADSSDHRYDLMALRSMQDWIIRLNLLGTPGVADVSSFGGYAKEYQAQVNPGLLRSTGTTLAQVVAALEQGSANTGATYIEHDGQALFIRGLGMAKNIEDLANTPIVLHISGACVLVRDVAEVKPAGSVRYGALSMNGQGEVVGGIVLMRKGENSGAVIAAVKQRMAVVQAMLPPGVVIAPYLDRTDLVSRTIGTVRDNLIEGGLIVVLVLVLLLGNLRAGLVVASVIPLAMLFAFGMMHAFGVSGNLMSLGAIDFGLIVDGAVIIVENVVRHLSHAVQARGRALSRSEMDDTVAEASLEIRKSAAFGEIIILIVYLPLLSLQGIEGKMFQPMALTVGFAILGALLLSLTYVPMMSALALSRRHREQHGLADRILQALYRSYRPSLTWALGHRRLVLAACVAVLVGTAMVFSMLGGEFIPKLDEGDYAIEFRLPVGTSLDETTRQCRQIERLLLQRYPQEIAKVVSKIGTAEIPTDPMPVEAADIMVVLHPPTHWRAGLGKQAITDSLEAFMDTYPGANISLQQPIEMRFNELIAGTKSDVVVKVFGADLNTLGQLGARIARIAEQQPGARDVVLQRVEGLPQLEVQYDRAALARHGIAIHTANQTLQTAFAGTVVNTFYEGERRYPVSVRLAPASRQHPDDIAQLLLPTATGAQVPLAAVAHIRTVNGPAELARENGQRRIHVGMNVSGRDIEGLVANLETTIRQQVPLPVGYRVEYGGEFENLQHAKDRLLLVVPLALGLIFVLLYFTFGSVRQAALIFTAIPLAAVGGVLALALRGLPFSISAGVGFIALAGVAVLNGIVLISYLNQLQGQVADVHARVWQAVQVRFRPVVMTALVASLGFIPMALATGAGAEVQKPLATVVIGGLVTATLLTLVVLPVLYTYLESDHATESVA